MIPDWVAKMRLRVRALLKRRQLDRDLTEELSFHLAMRKEKYEASGLASEDAALAARRRFGNLTGFKEACREMWTFAWFEELLQDVRYGLRQLRRNPGFTAVAVITLTLGIGANTAIFSVVDAVLLRPLPFERPSQLVDLWARSAVYDFPNMGLSLPDIADIRSQITAFAGIADYQYSSPELTGQGAPRQLSSVEASQGLFSLLGIRPLFGRLFRRSEMQPGADREVLLSYELWRGAFGGDPHAVGRSIKLDGKPYTITGVMPALPKINSPAAADIWTPFAPTKSQLANRDWHAFPTAARLKPGSTVRQAQAELNTLAARLAKAYPKADKNWSFGAVPLRSDLFGEVRGPLLVLLGAVGFVLLIACTNVANLVLSRGSSRRREIAMRLTLGATRRRIVRQLLIESLLLALIGGACGLLLALWGVYGLPSLIPADIPRIQDLSVNQAVLWFTLGISFAAGLLAGLAPAFSISRQDLSRSIKQGGAGTEPAAWATRYALRKMLVVAEVALAMILVVGAGLVLRSFARLLEVNLGFQPHGVLTMRLDFPPYRFKTPQASIQFVRQVIENVQAIHGVETASAAVFAPLSGWEAEDTLQIEGAPPNPHGQSPTVDEEDVAPGYFTALGIPLLSGRYFTTADAKGSPGVVIVNQTLARKIFGNSTPIGKRILAGTDNKGRRLWSTIVGEVGSVRDQRPRSAPKPEYYKALYQGTSLPGVSLIIRTRGHPAAFAPAIRNRISSLDKDQVVTGIMPMERLVAGADADPRFQALLLGIFGGLGLMLAAVGIYGVISYSVSQRTHEIGIRMALGAQRHHVLQLVIGQGIVLALAGVAIGILGALGLARFLSSLLYGVKPTDPLTFSTVSLILIGVALVACYVPARRATKVDAMVALRHE
jgi:predicted permease